MFTSFSSDICVAHQNRATRPEGWGEAEKGGEAYRWGNRGMRQKPHYQCLVAAYD